MIVLDDTLYKNRYLNYLFAIFIERNDGLTYKLSEKHVEKNLLVFFVRYVVFRARYVYQKPFFMVKMAQQVDVLRKYGRWVVANIACLYINMTLRKLIPTNSPKICLMPYMMNHCLPRRIFSNVYGC